MTNEERDINDIFDDIVLTEEKYSDTSYEEGFDKGVKEGNLEGYSLGYAKGVDLGDELGTYYGTIIAHLQITKSEKIKKILQTLKTTIEQFPKTNDPDIDIIAEIQNIRTQYKKAKAVLHLPSESLDSTKESGSKDLSF